MKLQNRNLKNITKKLCHNLWCTTQEYLFTDYFGSHHRIPAGFITDFQSTPKYFEWLAPHRGIADHAALEHDFLYKTQTVPRITADLHFCETLIRTGKLHKYRCQARYLSLRWLGYKAWEENHHLKNSFSMDYFLLPACEFDKSPEYIRNTYSNLKYGLWAN